MIRDQLANAVSKALLRTGNKPKVDRGWNWACYCLTCSELRKLLVAR